MIMMQDIAGQLGFSLKHIFIVLIVVINLQEYDRYLKYN